MPSRERLKWSLSRYCQTVDPLAGLAEMTYEERADEYECAMTLLLDEELLVELLAELKQELRTNERDGRC